MKQRSVTSQKLRIKKTIISKLGHVKSDTGLPTTSSGTSTSISGF